MERPSKWDVDGVTVECIVGDIAARVALRTVVEAAPELKYVREIRFVLFDRSALQVHLRALKEVVGETRS